MSKFLYSRQLNLPRAQGYVELDNAGLLEKPLAFESQLQVSGFENAFHLRFDCSPMHRAMISTQTPVRIQMSLSKEQLGEGEEWLPVMHGDSDNRVVGYCSVIADERQLRIVLTELPAAGQTIIVERLQEPWMPMGLSEAIVDGWGVRYQEVAPGRLKNAEAIALFVPGYMGNSSWMVHGLYPYLRDELDEYHTLLVFSYDWLGSPVEAMAQLLAAQLIEAGLPEANSKVDLFAYSLGCLVTRAAVELAGLAPHARNVVLMGSPSAGTPLASLPRNLPQVASNLLSRVGTLSLVSEMRRFARQIYGHLESLGDLEPGSALMQQLREATHPDEVRYLVLAGDNDADAAHLGLLGRLVVQAVDQSLDYYFAGQNDGVVSVESALYLHPQEPLGWITRQIVPCNHFGFFDDEDTRAAIEVFLKKVGADPKTALT